MTRDTSGPTSHASSPSTERRRRAYRDGHRAEGRAVLLLRLKGYRILARRLKTPVGEIDIVARRGRTIAFVEVKERPTYNQAAEAITSAQRQRICRAASWFAGQNRIFHSCDMRFDALIVVPGKWPYHIKNAWTA